MTQDELELREAIATERHDWGTVELVAEVRRLRGLVEAAYLEGNRDRLPEGDAELADIQWARSDAREALEGA